MKYYIIAGEASGDLHGSNLMKAIKLLDKKSEFRFWGGNKMKDVGGEMVKHYKDLAFMGFLEVAMNLKTILGNISFCKKDIEEYNPNKIIFIDYPGFNMRIAEWAKNKGYETFYYISPQIWAWKEGRVKSIKKNVDHMITILPFEVSFYAKHNYKAHFVGHPLLDAVSNRNKVSFEEFVQKNNLDKNKKIIGVLPGSRKQEISKILKEMVSVIDYFSDYQFVIGGAPSIDIDFYKEHLKGVNISVVEGQTYDLLDVSYSALVTSGTATLETAIFNVPEVVCYKSSPISYAIAKRVVGKRLKFISLVNLIMNQEIVKELIQGELNSKNIKTELEKTLNITNREKILKQYSILREKLGGEGASLRAAQIIVGIRE